MNIREAKATDAEAIARLIAAEAARGVLLPREREDVLEHLQEFLVAETDEGLAGAGALHIYDETLAEVRSLVVAPAFRGRGVGAALVAALEARAHALGIARVFALTYETRFFARLGYAEVPKESLPQKIWGVCVHCAHFPRCDETAMIKTLVQDKAA